MSTEITRTVYLVYDSDGISNANVQGDLGLISFAKQRLTDDDELLGDNETIIDLMADISIDKISVDDAIIILQEDGWTVEQNEVLCSE